jgi:hypothetical protein
MAKQSSIQKNLNRKNIVSKFKNRRHALKKKIMQMQEFAIDAS